MTTSDTLRPVIVPDDAEEGRLNTRLVDPRNQPGTTPQELVLAVLSLVRLGSISEEGEGGYV